MKTEFFMEEDGARKEHLSTAHQSLVNWKTIFAGLVIAFITHVILSALGAGVFGASIASTLENRNNDTATTLTGAAAIWMVLSCMLALFAGTYFATRTSSFVTGRIGAAQGAVIGALFFLFMFYGVGKTLGAAGNGIGSLLGAAGSSSASMLSSPAVQNTLDRAIGGLPLKSEPSVVVQELGVRMLRGNTESATNYLAYQTGLPASEVNARLVTLQNEFREQMQILAANTADAVAKTGWTLFAVLSLGMVCAIWGGAMGSRVNFRKPLADEFVASQFTVQTVL